MAKEKVDLLITSAVMIAGKMVVPDKGEESCVTLEQGAARNLLDRGKAELLTEDNKPTKAKSAKAKPAKADDGKAGDDKTQPDKDEK